MAPDGHQSFHMTLQLITKQGCKPLSVTVNPGTDANTILLSRYRSIFPQHFHSNVTLKANSLRKTKATWSLHDGKTYLFIGFFTVDVQHKTKPDVIPISFYMFRDSTRPSTPLSYSAYIHLGIVEFKVPSEANTHKIDSITKSPEKMKVSFIIPLYSSTPTKSTPKQTQKLKLALKGTTTNNNAFQDYHSVKVQSLQDHNAPFQDHSPIQNSIENNSFQDHFSSKDVQDIISLTKHSSSHLTL